MFIIVLTSVSALKSGETMTVDADGDGVDDFALTFYGANPDGSLDMQLSSYVGENVQSLNEGETTKMAADDGTCFYTTAKKLGAGAEGIELVETLCESTSLPSGLEEGQTLILPIQDDDNFYCFEVTFVDVDGDGNLEIDVNIPEQCLKTAGEEENEILLTADDGSCFKVTVVKKKPLELKVESSTECVPSTKESKPQYNYDGETCFEVKVTKTPPLEMSINIVDASLCGITPYKAGEGSSNKPSSDSSSSSSTSSGSMSGVPLKIPSSNPQYNDEYCNSQLGKQLCIDGYKKYSCEAYNKKGQFKEYKADCASCSNQKKDHNEEGIDCGGICSGTCVVGSSGVPTLPSAATGTPSVVQKPASSSLLKWLIPLIVLMLVAGLILAFVLFRHNKEGGSKSAGSAGPAAASSDVASKTDSDPLKGIPQDRIDHLHDYIKRELVKGHDRDKITSSLVSAGWKKEAIDHVFEEAHHNILPAEYEEQLRKYITYYVHKGMSQDQIKHNLILAGWKEEVIEKVLRKDL